MSVRREWRSRVAALAIVAGAASAGHAGSARAADPAPAHCQMALQSEMKVDFARNRPMLTGALNGHPVRALADTGASTSLISLPVARELGLPMDELAGYRGYGAGGNLSTVMLARVDELKFGQYAFHGLHMFAAGERRMGEDMLLGEDFMGAWDAEYDLPKGVIRLLTPNRLCGDGDMAYWTKAGQAYGMAPMIPGENGRKRVMIQVRLNGKVVRAQLDSGAQRSVATLRVADRAGVADRVSAGQGVGLGAHAVDEVFGRLDTFAVGDEVIRNTRLLFGDLFGGVGYTETGSHVMRGGDDGPEMLLGADFFRSHHVLISQTRRAVFFTYEGGPVFDVRPAAAPAPAVPPAAAKPAPPAAPPG